MLYYHLILRYCCMRQNSHVIRVVVVGYGSVNVHLRVHYYRYKYSLQVN